MSDLISRTAAINELGDLFTLCRESMPNENGKHYVTEEELCIFYMRLANISAIDAIPVEWIKDRLNKMLKGTASAESCFAIQVMLVDWMKEQEAR